MGSAHERAYGREDGALVVHARLVIPADEVELRVATSGGPGGQHANRSLTRVVASFRPSRSRTLTPTQRDRLLDAVGPVVRSSAGRHRSQAQNREAALNALAQRIAAGLRRRAPRRPTTPSRASQERRIEEKKVRGRLKQNRRRPDED